MTNLLPTFSVSWQGVHPSLTEAASRLAASEFNLIAATARQDVLGAQYGKLTHLLAGHGIEPVPEVVSQLCTGRLFFFGEELPHNLWQALTRMPQIYGNEVVDWLLASAPSVESVKDDLTAIGGSPYFRGDFSRILRLLQRTDSRDYRHGRLILEQQDEALRRLKDGLHLSELDAVLIGVASRWRVNPSLNFYVRNFAWIVGGNNELSSKIPQGLRQAFLKGFTYGDEIVRRAFVVMSPTLCADPHLDPNLKTACLSALRAVATSDPSPAIREEAARALGIIP